MADWTQLEQSLRDAGRRKTEQAARAQARAEAQRALDAWSAEVVPTVMAEVASACVTRASDLARTTGRVIDVTTPVRAQAQAGVADAFPLHVVALRIENVEVDVYSARGAGGLPALHVVSFCRHAQGERARRLVSEPGCLVSRRAGTDYELMSLSAQGGVPTSLDDLVHRAFTHLVQRWMSGRALVISSVA